MKPETLFDQVYEAYGPSLYRFCLLHMKNPSDAEDVMQEVFVKLLRAKPAFRDEEHRKAWLLRTALNMSRRLTGSSWRRKTVPLEEGEAAVFQEPEENLVWQALCSLEETYRLPLYLFYFQELPTGEIAKLLSLRPGTVRMRLSRGREQLREVLKGDFFDE